MRYTALCLTVCATLVLMTNAEGSQNVNTQEIKDQAQVKKRAILYNAELMGTNRNTDDNLDLPPLKPEDAPVQKPAPSESPFNGAGSPPAVPIDSTQSGGFGDRKSKNLKNKKKGGKKDEKNEISDKNNKEKKEEKKEENKVEEGDKNVEEEDDERAKESKKKVKDDDEEEDNEDDDKEDDDEDVKKVEKNDDDDDIEADGEDGNEDENDDEDIEEDDIKEDEEDEDDDGHAAQGVSFKTDSPQATISANVQYSQKDNTWYASESSEGHYDENEFTFRPATLAPEKTVSGTEPQSTGKSRQGVEKIFAEQTSGASVIKVGNIAVALSAFGSLLFSL